MNAPEIRPEVCIARDGRIAIFMGGAYRYLTIRAAQTFAIRLARTILNAEHEFAPTAAGDSTAPTFDEALAIFRSEAATQAHPDDAALEICWDDDRPPSPHPDRGGPS